MDTLSTLKINYSAVGLCVVLNMVVSALWYALFSELWMKANGISPDIADQQHGISIYITAFIANLISVYVIAWLFAKLRVESVIRGAMIGLLLAVAFYFVVNYTVNAFSFRPSILSIIDGGAVMLCWTISGCVLGRWSIYR